MFDRLRSEEIIKTGENGVTKLILSHCQISFLGARSEGCTQNKKSITIVLVWCCVKKLNSHGQKKNLQCNPETVAVFIITVIKMG